MSYLVLGGLGCRDAGAVHHAVWALKASGHSRPATTRFQAGRSEWCDVLATPRLEYDLAYRVDTDRLAGW